MDSFSTSNRPLRLWPGVLFAALIVITRFVAPLVLPDTLIVAIITGIGGGIAAAVCFALRLLAIHFRWQAPRASDLRDQPSPESGLERRRHAG